MQRLQTELGNCGYGGFRLSGPAKTLLAPLMLTVPGQWVSIAAGNTNIAAAAGQQDSPGGGDCHLAIAGASSDHQSRNGVK